MRITYLLQALSIRHLEKKKIRKGKMKIKEGGVEGEGEEKCPVQELNHRSEHGLSLN